MARPGSPTPPAPPTGSSRPGAPDGGGGRPGAPPPEAAAEAARRALLFSLLLLGALLAARLPQPWAAVGLGFTVAALVVGGLALAASLRARRRGSAAVLSAGLVLALLVLLVQSAALLLWPLQGSLRECLEGAVTAQARTTCQDEFTQRTTSWLEQVGGAGSG
ncbi:hypothetical protein WDZ17_03870 [Pseudokineococcus basanitobsidens]|uniref:Uncharacterized protein n=1 Tax=Pseudokineococcus basanitobsidens TaxID=1926649 RepID=A0ABU8RH81_9ACTN